MKVFKFGGASIKDAIAIKNVKNILENYQSESLVIIVSAMGKMTNALEKVVDAYVNKTGETFDLFNEVKVKHQEIMQELFDPTDEIFAQVSDTFIEIEWVIEEEPMDPYDYLYDQIVSIGEMVSSKIVAAYLNKNKLFIF